MSGNTVPSVIEKVVQDIDPSGGLDESRAEEDIDWTKNYSDVQNLVNSTGQYVQRKGAPLIATTDDTSTTLAPIFRAAELNGGMGLIGNAFQFYQFNEKLGSFTNKGKMPEFSVNRKLAGATGEVTTICGVAGSAILTNYYAIAYIGESISSGVVNSQLVIDIIDQLSNNIVRTYTVTSVGVQTYAMVGVDGRYLHVYTSLAGSGSIKPGMFVIDTQALPASGALTPSITSFTSSAVGDYVMGAVAVSGASVAIITSSASNNRIEKFNNSGASVSNAAIAGYTLLSGLDTDGTNFYVAGSLVEVSDPASLNLSGYWRDNAGTTPWPGVASAGGSGTNSAALGVAPTSGTALNAHTSSVFNGTTTELNTATLGATPTAGTIVCLVNITTLQLGGIYSNSKTGGTGYGIGTNTNGFVIFSGGNANTAQIKFPYVTGRWAVVALKWDSTTFRAKINRSDWVSVAKPATSAGSLNDFIGECPAGSQFYAGQIMNLIVSSTTLTDSQVDDIIDTYNARYLLSI